VSIHRTSSGKYEVRWREGTRNRSRTFDRRKDALDFNGRARRISQGGGVVPTRTGGVILSDFAAEWFVTKRRLAPRTRAIYQRLFETHIEPTLGYVPVNLITADRLDSWQRERLASGAGPESIAKSGKLLHQILGRARKLELIDRNPAELLEPVERARKRIVPATPEQVESMREWMLARERFGDATLISVLAYVGLRFGEALALMWPNVSLPRLTVCENLEDDGSLRPTKTADSDATLDLYAQPANDLREWWMLSGRPSTGFVFPRSTDGKGWTVTDRNNWRRRFYAKAAQSAGFSGPPKDLRHACASLMIAAGRPPTEVAAYLRHTLETSIGNYQHLIEQFKGQPIRPVEQHIAEARGQTAAERAS
jgi:integrase